MSEYELDIDTEFNGDELILKPGEEYYDYIYDENYGEYIHWRQFYYPNSYQYNARELEWLLRQAPRFAAKLRRVIALLEQIEQRLMSEDV